jgi:hypothetical protein
MPRPDADTDTGSTDFGPDAQAPTGGSPASAPPRSVRRATARRASRRRAAARGLHGDEETIVLDFLADHPGSTAGDLARHLNLDPDSVSTRLTHLVGIDEITRAAHGYTVNEALGPDSDG